MSTKFLTPREAVFNHPHYPSGVVIARLAISIASMLWSLLVISIDSALTRTPYGFVLLDLGFNEDYVAIGFIVLSAGNLFCIFRPCRPRKIGILGYSAMLFGWASIFLTFALKPIFDPAHPVQVTGITMSLVVAGLAMFAVVGGPRRGDCPRKEEGLSGSDTMVR